MIDVTTGRYIRTSGTYVQLLEHLNNLLTRKEPTSNSVFRSAGTNLVPAGHWLLLLWTICGPRLAPKCAREPFDKLRAGSGGRQKKNLGLGILGRCGAGNRPSTTPAGLALGVRAERFAIRTNLPIKAHTTGRLAKLADDDDSKNRVERRKRQQDRGCHTALSAPATVLNRQTCVCD